MADDDETLMTAALRAHFRSRSAAAIASEIQFRETLGQGHFGRVRLIESATARDAVVDHLKDLKKDAKDKNKDCEAPLTHSGFFALKIMKKSEIIRLKQATHVKDERHLLLNKLKNPFIVTAYHTYHDERNLYMIMEYVPGGELGRRMRLDPNKEPEGRFDNETSRFYVSQLVMALQYMHSDHIIYRGICTDNLMIDKHGYIKLVDFGFAKTLIVKGEDDPNSMKTYTLCGTPEYLAPEMVNNKGHGKGVDWWAVGIVIFEMLAGYPPFYADEPYQIYTLILANEVAFPKAFDGYAEDLIKKLLNADLEKRLGCKAQGAEDIKKHKWFRGLNWAALYNKQMPPPFVPELENEDDVTAFDNYPDSVEESGPLLAEDKQKAFLYWDHPGNEKLAAKEN